MVSYGNNQTIGSLFANKPTRTASLTTGGATSFSQQPRGDILRPTVDTSQPAPMAQPPQGQQPSYLGAAFQNMKTSLGNLPRVEYTPAAASVGAQFANQKPIQGLSNNYFQNMRTTMRDNLNKEMFGALGTAQDVASREGAAGRLDSGVGKRVLQNTVTDPYASGLVDIDTQIMQKQMEEAARVEGANTQQEQFRQQLMADIYKTDSANAMEASQANMNLAAKFSEIASDMAKYESGQISEQEMFNKKMEFDSIVAEIEKSNADREWAWNRSQDALSVNSWMPDTINQMVASGKTYEEVINEMTPALKAGGGVNYQQIVNMIEQAFGRAPTANVENFHWDRN